MHPKMTPKMALWAANALVEHNLDLLDDARDAADPESRDALLEASKATVALLDFLFTGAPVPFNLADLADQACGDIDAACSREALAWPLSTIALYARRQAAGTYRLRQLLRATPAGPEYGPF